MREFQRVVLEVARKRYDDQAFIAWLQGAIEFCVEVEEEGRGAVSAGGAHTGTSEKGHE